MIKKKMYKQIQDLKRKGYTNAEVVLGFSYLPLFSRRVDID